LLSFVTAAAMGLGVFSLAALGLGLAGWLNRTTAFGLLSAGLIAGAVALVLSGAWRERETFIRSSSDWLREPAGWGWLWLVVVPFLAIAVVGAMVPPGLLWGDDEPNGYDVVEYHLQIPREWYESGRVVPLRHNVFSYFPFNVEMHYLLAMNLCGGPRAGMYLAQLMHVAFLALTILAVYGFALPLTPSAPSRAGPTIAAVAAATVPWMTQLAAIAYNEGGLLLFGTLATGWAFLATLNPRRRAARFPVAGLMAGFAAGSKLTGVPLVMLAVGAVAGAAVIVSGLGRRRERATSETGDPPVGLTLRLAGVALFFACGLLSFSPWLIRNQVWAGNPLFPEAPVLGTAHFTPQQVERWKAAHSPRADQRPVGVRLRAAWREIVAKWQYGYLFVPLVCLSAVLAWRRPAARMLLGLLLIFTIFWLGFTHLQSRFFILAVPVGALIVAQVNWGRRIAVPAVAVVVMAGIGGAFLHPRIMSKLYEPPTGAVALLGVEQLDNVMTPPAYDDIPDDAVVILVGDATAFRYPVPTERLAYRTVFDVDTSDGSDLVTAWARTEAPPPPGPRWLLIDPGELRRFAGLHPMIPFGYLHVPPPPPDVMEHGQPYAVPAGEILDAAR
jgi:hypothetical protein